MTADWAEIGSLFAGVQPDERTRDPWHKYSFFGGSQASGEAAFGRNKSHAQIKFESWAISRPEKRGRCAIALLLGLAGSGALEALITARRAVCDIHYHY